MSIETDYAYAAGIIDGEGAIAVARKKHFHGFSYSLSVVVMMTDEEILMWLQNKFGGHVQHYNRSKKHPTWKLMYLWRRCGRDAAIFLNKIMPYLKLKRLRAELAVQMMEIKTLKGGTRGNVPLTPEQRWEKEKLAIAIRQENIKTNPAAARTAKWGVD